ncbi:MAG: ASKHA domain-containing protein [Candidatus Hodarchaeota archaeon]
MQYKPDECNLMEIIHQKLERILINSLCGGSGKCGKCRVKLLGSTQGQTNPPTKTEKTLLKNLESSNIRLACQVIPNGDIEVAIIDLSEYGDNIFKIQDSFLNFQLNFPFRPRITSQAISVPIPTLETPYDDFYRLSEALKESSTKIVPPKNPEVIRLIAKMLQDKDGEITGIIDQQKNTLINLVSHKKPLLGAVIDVGTTSVVATLIDLETGMILGADSIVNPQIDFGRDIMSRLTFALAGFTNRLQLQQTILTGVSELLNRLTSSTEMSIENINEIIVVGNSAMHHLFLNFPILRLSRAPFVPTITETLSFEFKEIFDSKELNITPQTIITLPPLIGGFIGSDAVVDILYTNFYEKDGVHLLIDFGTNSEIILVKERQLYAASVAAGGAFEGQHISCGMRGGSGAIEKFQIINGKYEYQTINSTSPKGICGTGIVDILAQLLIHKQLDKRGRLFERSGVKAKRLVLVPAGQTSTKHPIYINRSDVEAIQKAKAATLAAIRSLTSYLKIEINEINTVQIAGVFGSNLDIENAKKIGLLPDLPCERFVIQGNTAEKGGRTFLLSLEARKISKTIATSVQRLELTQFPKFQSYFTEELFFPQTD